MGEFSSRVEAQRQILKVVNSRSWPEEQLFALTANAILRWASVNNVDTSTPLIKSLSSVSAQIFVMANHSDDPISGAYRLSVKTIATITEQLKEQISTS